MFYFTAKVHKSQKSSVNSVLCQTKLCGCLFFREVWKIMNILICSARHKTNKYWARHWDMSRPFCRLWVRLLLQVLRKKQLVPPNLSAHIFPMWQTILSEWFVSPDYMFWKYRTKIIIETLQCNDHGPVMFCCLHSPRSLCNVILVLVLVLVLDISTDKVT